MTYRKSMLLLGLVLLVGIVGYVGAQSPVERTRTDRDSLPQPIHRVAHKTTDEPEAKTGEHPLEPALEIARKCLENIQTNIQDYSASMVKHERIDGKLADVEYMFVKIRHQPFSAYTYFKAPENLKGQEALYMGYANVPFAVGWTSGAFVAGVLYDHMSDKANLAIRYLQEHGQSVDGLERTKAMDRLQAFTNTDPIGATDLLWNAYHPYQFWYAFVGVGLASAVGMVLYARAASRWKTGNA